jgi:hypothetical protein
MIDSKKLIGVWYMVDSMKYKIEFIDSRFEFMMKIENDNPYYFSKDTIGNISSSGYYPQWPPLNCDLYFISNDTLKVTYSQLGVPAMSFVYIKNNK